MTKKRQIQPVQDLSPAMPMTHDCVTDIREIIAIARRSVVRHVNTTMTFAYWLVGRRIVVEEQQGKRVLTLPTYLGLKPEDATAIAEMIKEIVK